MAITARSLQVQLMIMFTRQVRGESVEGNFGLDIPQVVMVTGATAAGHFITVYDQENISVAQCNTGRHRKFI